MRGSISEVLTNERLSQRFIGTLRKMVTSYFCNFNIYGGNKRSRDKVENCNQNEEQRLGVVISCMKERIKPAQNCHTRKRYKNKLRDVEGSLLSHHSGRVVAGLESWKVYTKTAVIQSRKKRAPNRNSGNSGVSGVVYEHVTQPSKVDIMIIDDLSRDQTKNAHRKVNTQELSEIASSKNPEK